MKRFVRDRYIDTIYVSKHPVTTKQDFHLNFENSVISSLFAQLIELFLFIHSKKSRYDIDFFYFPANTRL